MIISITNNKGGVGKTTTAETLGDILSQTKKKKVLLVDLDTQHNLTNNLLKQKPDLTVYDLLKRNFEAEKGVYKVRKNLFLIAGYEAFEIEGKEPYLLKNAIETIIKDFDFVLIDCPPGFGMVTINALAASDGVLIPSTAESRPLEGLVSCLNICGNVKKSINPNLEILGVLITRYNRRKANKSICEALRSCYPDLIFQTVIRENAAIFEASLNGCTLLEYAPEANGAKDYICFADEFLKTLKK